MTKCKISVIVPVYRVAAYVRQCLDSIAAQTLGDIEVLCVDDCGGDGSMAIVQEFAGKDDRFRILRHDRNRGQGAGRNTGLDAARGDYVAFVDADDWIEPDMLAREHALAEDLGLDCLWTKYRFYYEDSGRMEIPSTGWEAPGNGGSAELTPALFAEASASPCTKLFRRAFIEDHRLRFPEGVFFEDLGFFFKFHCLSTRTYTLDEHPYVYRRRAGSTIAAMEAGSGRCEHMIRVCLDSYDFLKDRGLLEEKGDLLVHVYSRHFDQFLYSRHYKEEMLRLTKSMLRDIGFPDRYDAARAYVFNAVAACRYNPSLRKWYKLLSAANKLNPFPETREKWKAWIRVNCLAR